MKKLLCLMMLALSLNLYGGVFPVYNEINGQVITSYYEGGIGIYNDALPSLVVTKIVTHLDTCEQFFYFSHKWIRKNGPYNEFNSILGNYDVGVHCDYRFMGSVSVRNEYDHVIIVTTLHGNGYVNQVVSYRKQ